MLEIKAQRRLATIYTCPGCGSTHGYTLTPPSLYTTAKNTPGDSAIAVTATLKLRRGDNIRSLPVTSLVWPELWQGRCSIGTSRAGNPSYSLKIRIQHQTGHEGE
jgi:hypothetical protein